jgi:DNA repair protein RecO (recombination protein O)
MEWRDEAFVLSARPHGESGAVVQLLTLEHGRFAAHVAGGGSRRMKPYLQAGSRVLADFRAKTPEQLGSVRLEPAGEGVSVLFDDPLGLAGVAAAAAVAQGALPEREPHPSAFAGFEALLSSFAFAEIWPAVFVRYEVGLLEELGFGLDFSRCASTGRAEDLVYVSPRTGRAVSRGAAQGFEDRLLPLPPFLLSGTNALGAGDVGRGLDLTGHFLARFVFSPLDRPLPPARERLLDRLAAAERL